MAKIERLPSGNYRTRIYIGEISGVKKFKSITAPSVKEVKFLVSKYELKTHSCSIDMTVGEAAERFLEERRLSISPATYKCYNVYLRNRFLDLQTVKISKLTRSVVQLAVNDELERVSEKTGKPLGTKTVHEALAFFAEAVRSVDEYAVDFKKISFPRQNIRKDNTPEPEKMTKIILAIKDTPIELPVLLASMMSLRTGEIRGLQWQDYDGEYLIIRRSKLFKDTVKSPKTQSSVRTIKVPKKIKEVLDNMPRGDADDFIYPCGESTILKRFYSTCRKNGIEPCTVHELRHYFASQALQSGIDEKVVQSIGGWKSPLIMRRTYQKTFKSARDEAIDILEQKFDIS